MKLIVKNLLFTIFVPGTVAVYVPLLIARKPLSGSPAVWMLLGLCLLITGCAIYLWTVWDFLVDGRGTPSPTAPPSKLVVRGLYHFVRNPMYLGVLLVILGWAAIFRDEGLLIYAFAVALASHLFVIFYEEPRLKQLFGIDYKVYCEEVGRWLPRSRKSAK